MNRSTRPDLRNRWSGTRVVKILLLVAVWGAILIPAPAHSRSCRTTAGNNFVGKTPAPTTGMNVDQFGLRALPGMPAPVPAASNPTTGPVLSAERSGIHLAEGFPAASPPENLVLEWHNPALGAAGGQPEFNLSGQPGVPFPIRFDYVLEDLETIASYPFQWNQQKWDHFWPVAAGTVGLMFFDNTIDQTLKRDVYPGLRGLPSNHDADVLYGLGGFWLLSTLTRYGKGQQTAELACESLLDTMITTQALKMYTGRARPVNGHGPGEWFRCDIEVKGDYTSFPSLHVGSYFSLAAVFGESYKISWLTYPAAAWLMYVEFPGHNHWASDIFAGGAIGVAIGQMVMNRRSPPPTGSWRFAPTAGGGGPGIMLQREF